jgi:hypothetical protein
MSTKSGLARCIRNAFEQGEISKEERDELNARLAELVAAIPNAKQVQDTLIAEIEAKARERERIALLAETARKQLTADIFNHRNARGEQDVAEAFALLHGHFGEGRMVGLENLERSIMGVYMSKLDELVLAFEKGAIVGDKRLTSKWVGDKPTMQLLENVVRELFGEATGDAKAAALAKAYDAVREQARQEFNALGGSIGKLEKYGLSQGHDAEAVLAYGKTKWVARLMEPGVLDRQRMIDQRTKRPLTDEQLREALEVSWERITTDGWFDRKVTAVPTGRGALYKQHQDHRFIHFANADEWMKYARDFSGGNHYAAMMGHLQTMARDIAAMKIFGPNPTSMRTYLKNLVTAHYAKAPASNAVHRAQMQEVQQLTEALVASSGLDGWQQTHADLLRAASQIIDDINRIRERKHGPRAPGTLAWKPADGPAPKEIAEKLAALDRAMAAFNKWLDENPRPSDLEGGGKPMAPDDEIATRERIREIMDGLREEVLLPAGNWQGRADRQLKRADQMWDIYRGTATTPVDVRLANGFRTVRNVLTAARLGSAIASAVTDIGFQKMARKFVGIERTGVGAIVGDMTKMLSTMSRAEAIRAGLILDSAMHIMETHARENGALQTTTMSGYLADRVIALQGLATYTQGMKWGFGMEFQGMFADYRGRAFADLPDAPRAALERHGFTPAEWDKMRSVPTHSLIGRGEAGILRPAEIEAAHGMDLARKYLMMIHSETSYAVIEPTLRARAIMTAGSAPGTIMGEALRSATQFKSFGITVLLMHGGRALHEMQSKGWRAGMAYAVPLMITTTLLGAVALQIKELIAGREPRSMADERFWGAAMLQGGGLGIMGDFLNSSNNRFGGGFTSTVAGPIAGEVDKLLQYTIGNTIEAKDGKKTNIGRETVDMMRRLTPGANLIWTRLATERLFFDQMQRLMDPEADDAWRRRVRNRRRDVGNEFWWAPGEASPRGAPSFGNVLTPVPRQ